jgi:hypothetical protein
MYRLDSQGNWEYITTTNKVPHLSAARHMVSQFIDDIRDDVLPPLLERLSSNK